MWIKFATRGQSTYGTENWPFRVIKWVIHHHPDIFAKKPVSCDKVDIHSPLCSRLVGMVRPRLVGAYVWLFITVSAVNQVGASEERVHVSGAEPQPTQQTDDADTGRVLSLLQATSALEETMKAYPSMDWANHRAEHAKVDPAPAPALLAADSAVPKRGKPRGIGKPGQGDDSSQLSQDEWFDSMLQKEVEQKKQVPPLSSDQEEQVTSLVELRRSGLQFGLSSSMTMIPTFPQAQLESGVNRLLGKLGVLGEGKPMPCQGLVPKMCKPCPLGNVCVCCVALVACNV